MRALPWSLTVGLVVAAAAACTNGSREGAAAGTERAAEGPISDNLLLAVTKVGLPPGTAPADLPDADSEGAALVVQFCTACHALTSPGTHSATDWPAVIRRMWLRTERAAQSFGLPVPDTGERLLILRYLLDNALRVTEASLPEAPGRNAFTATCSRCHELPDPAQHSPGDWPAVVLRMGQRIQEMLGESLAADDVQRIAAYLERVSGGG